MRRLREYLAIIRRILRYRNAKWYHGKRIRWMIEDSAGTSVYCDFCGNIANAIKQEYFATSICGGVKLNVPICKRHAKDLLQTGEYKLDESGFVVFPTDRRR